MRAALSVAALGLALSAGSAYADTTFEAQAQGAKPVKSLEDFVWTFAGNCSWNRNDVQTRQCKALQAKQLAALKTQALLVEGEASAFVVSPFDDKRKSAPTTLVGCISCAGIKLDGESWRVLTSAPKSAELVVENGSAKPTLLLDRAELFPDAAAVDSWSKATGTPRVQFVVSAEGWRQLPAGGKTIVVSLLAWRVIAPCTGEILASSAPSQPLAPDKKACSKK